MERLPDHPVIRSMEETGFPPRSRTRRGSRARRIAPELPPPRVPGASKGGRG